jgi:hypothetical protein
LTTARDEDICAFRNEPFRRGQPETAAATGDEGDFTRELIMVAHSFVLSVVSFWFVGPFYCFA